MQSSEELALTVTSRSRSIKATIDTRPISGTSSWAAINQSKPSVTQVDNHYIELKVAMYISNSSAIRHKAIGWAHQWRTSYGYIRKNWLVKLKQDMICGLTHVHKFDQFH